MTGRNSWQQVMHAEIHSDLFQVLKGGTFDSSGFSKDRTLISSSTVPQSGSDRDQSNALSDIENLWGKHKDRTGRRYQDRHTSRYVCE